MQNATKRKQTLLETATAAVQTMKAAKKAADEAEEDEEEEESDDDDDTTPKQVSPLRKAANDAETAARAARAAYDDFAVPRAMELAAEIAILSKRVYAHGKAIAHRAASRWVCPPVTRTHTLSLCFALRWQAPTARRRARSCASCTTRRCTSATRRRAICC